MDVYGNVICFTINNMDLLWYLWFIGFYGIGHVYATIFQTIELAWSEILWTWCQKHFSFQIPCHTASIVQHAYIAAPSLCLCQIMVSLDFNGWWCVYYFSACNGPQWHEPRSTSIIRMISHIFSHKSGYNYCKPLYFTIGWS